MIVVIDTSSLLSLVRYYLPFDKNSILFDFMQTKIEKGEIIIIDKVIKECEFTSGGLVLKRLQYLEDKVFKKTFKVPVNTEELLAPAPQRFANKVRNQFVNSEYKKQKGITEVQFEVEVDKFYKSADLCQVILCLNLISKGNEVCMVTEESENSNDNKLFKKIPAICKLEDIPCCTLPDIIQSLPNIDIDFIQ